MKTFVRIRPDMTKNEVLRILGPSDSSGTAYFKARDELLWERPYCDEWNERARFEVLFDGSKKVVRSTMNLTDYQGGCVALKEVASARTPIDFLITAYQDGPNLSFKFPGEKHREK